ncbi:MAG: glycosyltransferase family 4 protein, partial [Chloroflexi bacterium]|nr:glycosyltransferase family 4 protein [Chloroflexota bacterium]
GSNYLRAQLIELQVADAARVRVVPMPVAPAFLNFELPADHARSPRKILTVARLTKQKNIETLLEAMIPLQRILRAELRIIGDGPERAALEKFARARNLTNVEFLGAVPQKDLPRYYAECAVFVLPSIREGMGLVLAEALLCGAPVIAVNSGGVTDIAQENETGLLVPERDVRALVDAICRIFADPALAARLAHNGAARVRERFSSARVAEIFHEIFSSVHRSSSTV